MGCGCRHKIDPDVLLGTVTPRAPEPEVFDREVLPGNRVLETQGAPDGGTLVFLFNERVQPYHEFQQYPYNLVHLDQGGVPTWLGGTETREGVLRFWLADQRLEWSTAELLAELPHAGPEYQGFVDWLERVASLDSPALHGRIGRLIHTAADFARKAAAIWSRRPVREHLRHPAHRRTARAAQERKHNALQIDRAALKRVLAGSPAILEALEGGALKATGRPGVNVAQMWLLTRRALYASADVPVLGTREALQNSADAIRAAWKARQIRQDEGRFAVTWDAEKRSLTWEDNGIGMDADAILTKFLVLGASGKTGAADSDEAAGGFGVAKAVILGTASRFRWEMHSRDNLAVSKGADGDVEVFEAPMRQGTRITVFDVADEYDWWWDSAGGGRQPLERRLVELLGANDLPGITLLYNGEVVSPLFSRRGGSSIQVQGSWGQGTMARVKAYRRPDRRGAYWVRLNGLYQFKSGSSGDLGVDVVLDLSTVVRPGEKGYPLNAGRDAMQGEARYTFRALIEEVERENASVGDKQDDEVFDPETETDDELAGDVQDLTRQLLDDPELAKTLESVGLKASRPDARLDAGALVESDESRTDAASTQGGTSPIQTAGGRASTPVAHATEADTGTSFAHSEGDADATIESPAPSRAVLKTDLPDEFVLDLHAYKGRLPWFPAGLQTVRAIQNALERAEQESPYEIHPQVQEALEAAGAGALTVGQLRVIAIEMDRAARTVAQARGDGRPHVQVAERKQQRRTGNPFGHLGALRVSRVNYDKAKARAFKRNPRRWLPYLLLWDTTLKLVAHAGDILRLVKPGFVLEDGVVGLAQRRPDSQLNVVYIHPDRMSEAVERNRERPLAIAAFLHGVACHELTHVDGRMGDGHSEAFVSAREDLGSRTAFLLPQLANLVAKLLKLPEPKDETQAKLSRLERQLQKAKEKRDTAKAETGKTLRQLERELAACRREVETRAASLSAQARAACTGACGCEMGSSAPRVPRSIQIPPAHRYLSGPDSSGTDGADPSDGVAPLVRARAERAFELVRSGLLQNRPAGVSPEYVEAFLSRYRSLLLERLAGALEQRRPEAAVEVVESLPRRKLTATPFSRPKPGEIARPLDYGQVRQSLQIGAPARLRRDYLDKTWGVVFPKGTEGIVTDVGEEGWIKGLAILELDNPVRAPNPEDLRDWIETIYVPAKHLENW